MSVIKAFEKINNWDGMQIVEYLGAYFYYYQASCF